MKRFDMAWLLALTLFSTEVLAKRRRSDGSAALANSEFFGWVALAALGVGALILLYKHAEVINTLVMGFWLAVAAWFFAKWSIDVASCAYTEILSPERLPELCVAEGGEPHGILWRYGNYLLAALLYSALFGGAISWVRKRRRESEARVRERRRHLEAALLARLPLSEHLRLAAHVTEYEAMIDALERQSNQQIPNHRVAAVVDLGLALTKRRHAAGRELTEDEVCTIIREHRI